MSVYFALINNKNTKCCICCEPFVNPKAAYMGHRINNNVSHVFHQACISQWINYHHSTCPLCRVVISNSSKLLGTAVCNAVEENYSFSFLRSLLASGKIDQELLGTALLYAVKKNKLDEVEELLLSGTIDQKTLAQVHSL